MNHIREYYQDLRDKAAKAENKNTLKFLQYKAMDKLRDYRDRSVKLLYRKLAIKEYRKTIKAIKKRAKKLNINT